MHVFAISGLHVMAVASVLSVLARLLFWLPRRWAGAAVLPFLWGYVVVIGCPPSAVRAAAMASVGALAPVFWRRPDGLTAWSVTFLAIHLYDPLMIVNVGSALSFGVMLAILLTGDALRGWGALAKGLMMTLAAWAAGVPIAAHVFGRITPGGLLANLVLIAVAKITVYAGTLGMVMSMVSETAAAHLNALAALCTEGMVLMADAVSRLPGSNFEVATWPIWLCGVWYVGILALVWLGCRYRRYREGIWYNFR